MLAAITMKLSLIVLGAIAFFAALSLKWGSKTEIASSEDHPRRRDGIVVSPSDPFNPSGKTPH